MNGSHVERIVTVANAQKAGRLFEGLRADSGYLEELRARAEAAHLISILNEVDGRAFGDSGNMPEQRPGRRIEVDSHAIYATLDCAFK
jgi:hypothetical protein